MNVLPMSYGHKIQLSRDDLVKVVNSGCDLEVMIRAFQALCPGSIPGVRIIFRPCMTRFS